MVKIFQLVEDLNPSGSFQKALLVTAGSVPPSMRSRVKGCAPVVTESRRPAPSLTTNHLPSGLQAKLLFGQLAELNKRPWPLEAHRCTSCRHVELFDRSE